MDKHLPAHYDMSNFSKGKRACKEALQKVAALFPFCIVCTP